MKRQLPGLSEAVGSSRSAIPDGVFLVRIASAQYRWHAQKPFYGLSNTTAIAASTNGGTSRKDRVSR
jgi:hypothetical protein